MRALVGAAGVPLAAAVLTACSISAAPPAALPITSPSTAPSLGDRPAAEGGGAYEPELIRRPDPSEAEPVARGMTFGDKGRPISVGRASDEVASRPRYRRLQAFRDRVAQVAQQLVDEAAPQEQAALTGTSADFGSFTYTYTADGRIHPDRTWVSAYIRTESVPILGEITCHEQMFPQLRGALRAVVAAGLEDAIHAGEYGGCYVPRFIASDPRNPISLHTWGIAIDLNVPGNLRGTVGEIDRRVVDIFETWGFSWGGDWNYTDPMHFELARLL